MKETSSIVLGIGGKRFLRCRYIDEGRDGNVGTLHTAADAGGICDKATMVSVYIVGIGVDSLLALSFSTSIVFETVT